MLQYGVANDLAEKAAAAGLTVTKIRALSQKDMIAKCGLSKDEAVQLKTAVERVPIDAEVVQLLLDNSNYLCNACKGDKSHAYIIHHIEEYAVSQDNSYNNLVVLCPNDHDLAHRGGLTMGITQDQLRKSKSKWEKLVEIGNAQRAAQAIDVSDNAIDYVNVKRIEELCMGIFKEIPETSISARLQSMKVLNVARSFDQKYVQSNLSGGRYLFDYMSVQETEHYKQLMTRIAKVTEFVDLDVAAAGDFTTLKQAEGKYGYFIGGVCAKGPDLPITTATPAILLHYSRKGLRIEWPLDPMFLMSMSAITRIGGKNRYIVYCLVRTVEKDDNGNTVVKASPLLIAQPTKYVHKTPSIAYQRQYDRDVAAGLIEEVDGSTNA